MDYLLNASVEFEVDLNEEDVLNLIINGLSSKL